MNRAPHREEGDAASGPGEDEVAFAVAEEPSESSDEVSMPRLMKGIIDIYTVFLAGVVLIALLGETPSVPEISDPMVSFIWIFTAAGIFLLLIHLARGEGWPLYIFAVSFVLSLAVGGSIIVEKNLRLLDVRFLGSLLTVTLQGGLVVASFTPQGRVWLDSNVMAAPSIAKNGLAMTSFLSGIAAWGLTAATGAALRAWSRTAEPGPFTLPPDQLLLMGAVSFLLGWIAGITGILAKFGEGGWNRWALWGVYFSVPFVLIPFLFPPPSVPSAGSLWLGEWLPSL